MQRCGLRYHSYFRILICTTCQLAYPSCDILLHLKNRHNMQLHQDQQTALCSYHVLDSPTPPSYPNPPVEGLKVSNGFKCKHCPYAASAESTIIKHCGQDHKSIEPKPKDRYFPSSVQTFYYPITTRYFAVEPSLANHSPDSPFALFVRDIASNINLSTQSQSFEKRNIHPLILKTGWHHHLQEYLTTQNDIRRFVKLTATPTASEHHFANLSTAVTQYLKDARKIAYNAPYLVRRMLKEYPM